MNEAPAIQTPPPCTSDASAGSPPQPETPAKPIDPHSRHHLFLDRYKFRGVYVTAPSCVTKAEMERIKGWLETLFIVEDDAQPR